MEGLPHAPRPPWPPTMVDLVLGAPSGSTAANCARCPAPRAQPRCKPSALRRPDGPTQPRDPTKRPGLAPAAGPQGLPHNEP